MQETAVRWYIHLQRWPYLLLEILLAFTLAILFIVNPVTAAMRLQERSLYMNSSSAGANTFYKVGFRYMSPKSIGSVELLFCEDPIPYHPCVTPKGMDVSKAILGSQEGETGFSIGTRSTNRLVLTRSSMEVEGLRSIYRFDNIKNPVDTKHAFAIRLKTFASSDATGPQVDFGSIRGQITDAIEISAQVPPMLIFCLAQQVEYNCTKTNNINYTDMGQLSSQSTLTAQSQMAVGTNATAGFVITANGAPLTAGTNIIKSLERPTLSQKGEDQFGINLVANTEPVIGNDPEGEWVNAVVSSDYAKPNLYKYKSGDTVASSPNVSLMRKFTVSYIVNSHQDLKPGIYTTTINFIASGRF